MRGATDHTYPRSFLDERAAHHEKCADLLAIDGVTLSLDEARRPWMGMWPRPWLAPD